MKGEKGHIFSGIPTFMQSPYISLSDAGQFDAVVLGIPYDLGVSYRGGQRLAPRALREHSFWYRVDGEELFSFDHGGRIRTNGIAIADIGDITIWPGDTERTMGSIIDTVAQIRASSFPLIIGGDHSISYPAYIGCTQALQQGSSIPIGLLHFDAHIDTEERVKTLPRIHHGNFLGQLIREGYLLGSHAVSIGLRGFETPRWVDFAIEHGIKIYTVDDVRRRTFDAVLDEVVAMFNKECKGVYVTFDMDCLDPSHAPGTGTPVFGGFFVEEIYSILHHLSRLTIVGFDLVELTPQFDVSGVTSIAACEILWRVLAFGLSFN